MKSISNYQEAFSLIELLVTIVVIGILASISIAAYTEYRKRAYHTIAITQANDYMTAATAAISDGIFEPFINPTGVSISPTTGTASIGNGLTLAQALPGFNHQRDVFIFGSIDNKNTTEVWATHCKGPVILYMGSYDATISHVCRFGAPCYQWVVHPLHSGCTI